MVAPAAKTSRMRQRKLNLKQPLQVVREDDLESFEANEPTLKEIQTGVEAHEEQEHHLQAVISAAQAAAAGGSAAKASIPTRGTNDANLPYNSFYALTFAQPATYIRFSSTVEDCIDGAAYDIVDEDDEFIRSLNEKLRAQAQQASSRPTSRSAAAASESTPQTCSEGQFESDMTAFEAAAKLAAPFSNSVTGDQAAPILSLDEQLAQLPETLLEESAVASSSAKAHSLLRALAPHIYPHWQTRRSQNGNSPLTPLLKVKVLETGDALDDNDPYVCFRRREVRAVRKTRGRDAQSSEKLRLLRRQLDDARQLLQHVFEREKARKDVLTVDKILFEQRSSLRGLKRSLPAQYQEGDLDLLINQRAKKPLVEPVRAHTTHRPTVSTPTQVNGPDLQLLEEWYENRRRQQIEEITRQVQQHKQWNTGFVDDTTTPVKPMPPDTGLVGGFRAARTEYLPTPPASSASGDSPPRLDESDEAGDRNMASDGMRIDKSRPHALMTASPPDDGSTGNLTSGRTTGVSTPGVAMDINTAVSKTSDWSVAKGPRQPSVHVRYASPSSSHGSPVGRSPSFRRRIGRGGRVWIDRRHMPRLSTPEEDDAMPDGEAATGLSPLLKERFKFDHDSDDDVDDDLDHVHKEIVDPYEWQSMMMRAQNSPKSFYASAGGNNAALAAHAQMQKQRQLQLQAQAQGHAAASGQGVISNPQTVRQQVAAQQHAAAQAAAANNSK